MRIIADKIWAFIARIFGWRPGTRTKNTFEWIGAITGALLGVWGIIALVSGDDPATKQDIEALKRELSGKIERLMPVGADDAVEGLANDLAKAVETLLAAGRADALKDKTGEAAEEALDELIAQRRSAREKVARDEADLYRQKGALAFLHDTQKALAAYAKATELDSDDAEGWNKLGHLQKRLGDLNAAQRSYERVLALGNQIEDQSVIAVATGNLGNLYWTRGDLDAAEAMYRKSLAIDEALGRKEGMALNYADLGNLYQRKGDMASACAYWRKARDLFAQIGMPHRVEENERFMRESDCPEG